MKLHDYERKIILQILSIAFFFFIPIRIFLIGDGAGWGIQGINYQFQVTSYGPSFIPINNAIGYVVNGNITGLTAYSIIFSTFGSILFSIWFMLILIPGIIATKIRRYFLLICSLLAFAIGDIIQYGPFVGPAGVVIPLYIAEFIILINYEHETTKIERENMLLYNPLRGESSDILPKKD